MTAIRRLTSMATRGGLYFVAALGISSAQAACKNWDLSGQWRFAHSNGYVVDFNLEQTGSTITGSGLHTPKRPPKFGAQFNAPTSGHIVGGSLTGNLLSFSIPWKSGAIGEYAGSVDENGYVSGMTYDRAHPDNVASWRSDRPAICVVAKTKPVDPVKPKKLVPRAKVTINKGAPKTLGEPLGPTELPSTPVPGIRTATVTGDVDLYDIPGGEGTVIGMLSQGAQVSASCRDDQWCAVSGEVPTGKGWVWGKFLAF